MIQKLSFKNIFYLFKYLKRFHPFFTSLSPLTHTISHHLITISPFCLHLTPSHIISPPSRPFCLHLAHTIPSPSHPILPSLSSIFATIIPQYIRLRITCINKFLR